MTTEHDAADEYHDGNERDIRRKQAEAIDDSGALAVDDDVDPDDVQVLPGTGGPDDVGEVRLEPGEYDPEGRS